MRKIRVAANYLKFYNQSRNKTIVKIPQQLNGYAEFLNTNEAGLGICQNMGDMGNMY